MQKKTADSHGLRNGGQFGLHDL